MLIAHTNRTGRVPSLIRSACRRRTRMLALEDLGLASAAVLAGFILMLVLGTQVLHWYWLLLLSISGLGIAGYRVYARRLSSYRVAQLLDARLHLSDSLSTAWFLLTQDQVGHDGAACFQIAKAEQIAASVDPARVFGLRGGRPWALAGALAAVALGLFAVRYLITSNLSLQRAIIPLQIGEVLERIENRIAAPNQRKPELEADRRQDASPAQPAQQYNQQAKITGQQKLEADNVEDKTGQTGAKRAETQNAGDPNRPLIPGTNGQKESSALGHARPDTQSGQATSKDKSSQQVAGSKENPGSNQQDSQALMDKMKDALSSLMAKLHPNVTGQNPSQDNQRLSPDKSSGDQMSAARDQNGNAQQSPRDQEAYQKQNAEGRAQGQTIEKTQTSQNQDSGESPDKKSASAHSGIGHTNGGKDIKDAEQLKAMGKLAEIIGKRSASLTGDMTVETSSTNQQLKTQYTGRVGRHTDLGGEVNRDEIPVIYRDYVREYMQLVHKQAEKQQ
ncbi:MAG TPA: hypothetical protein VH601_03130 [Bryobacteraceae bacterium]